MEEIIRFGFEAYSGHIGRWDHDVVGQQDESNLFASPEAAEGALPGLAEVLDCDPRELRVCAFRRLPDGEWTPVSTDQYPRFAQAPDLD